MTRRHSLITAILPLGCKIPCHSAIIKSIDNGTVLGANAIDTKVLALFRQRNYQRAPKHFY